MQHSWMKWLGMGLVAPALALGCRQSRQYSGDGMALPPPMVGAMAPSPRGSYNAIASLPPTSVPASVAPPLAAAHTPYYGTASLPPMDVSSRPAVPPSVTSQSAYNAMASLPPTDVPTGAAPPLAAAHTPYHGTGSLPPAVVPNRAAAPLAAALPSAYHANPKPADLPTYVAARPQPAVMTPPRGQVMTQKVSTPVEPQPVETAHAVVVDPSQARYHHSPYYTTLIGELHYVPRQDAWRLRYAPVDEEDRYGGCVTLPGGRMMQGFKSGQFVRIEGELVDPQSRKPSPEYRVRDIYPLTLGQ